jgi:hypothetical protein
MTDVNVKGNLTADERQTYNLMIVEMIATYLSNKPMMRFGQALYCLGVTMPHQYPGTTKDNFYEEPDVTYRRVKVRFENLMKNGSILDSNDENVDPRTIRY